MGRSCSLLVFRERLKAIIDRHSELRLVICIEKSRRASTLGKPGQRWATAGAGWPKADPPGAATSEFPITNNFSRQWERTAHRPLEGHSTRLRSLDRLAALAPLEETTLCCSSHEIGA